MDGCVRITLGRCMDVCLRVIEAGVDAYDRMRAVGCEQRCEQDQTVDGCEQWMRAMLQAKTR